MSNPVQYLQWSRSSMTDEDQVVFSFFDRLSRLPTWKLLKFFLCNQRWVDLSGMYTFALSCCYHPLT